MLLRENKNTLTLAESLVARIVSGDKQAEQELVSTYYRGLLFILKRQTQNHALSDDLAQDTFIVVIQRIRDNEIKKPQALSAFIRQTGINILIGHQRKETRRDTHSSEDIEIHPPTHEMDIAKALHSKKLLAITQQLFEELTVERDKELLRSYFIYEKTKQQICQNLDLSPEHFDRVLFRARQRLKQLIQHKLGSTDNTYPNTSTLISIGICLGVFTQQSTHLSNEILIVSQVRDIISSQHLPIETPITQSRNISELNPTDMQLTTKSRCV